MTNSIQLCDDGTMDTVFQCKNCGEEIRYSEADRDEDGDVTEDFFEQVANEHECEQDASCDQCQALMVNGLYCHEQGCPNTKKVKIEGEWVSPEIDED